MYDLGHSPLTPWDSFESKHFRNVGDVVFVVLFFNVLPILSVTSFMYSEKLLCSIYSHSNLFAVDFPKSGC